MAASANCLYITIPSCKDSSSGFKFYNMYDISIMNFIKKEPLALVFSCEFYEISKNIFLHRTPLLAAPETTKCMTVNI